MQRLRIGIHHFFDHGERFAAAAFHHVGRQRPRAAGKTNQRHFAFQFATNGTHRVHHVTQLIFRVRNWQFIDVGFAGDWRGKTRTFSGFKNRALTPIASGTVRDIGKEDRRIQRVATQRLQSHFARQLGVFAQRHKNRPHWARVALYSGR